MAQQSAYLRARRRTAEVLAQGSTDLTGRVVDLGLMALILISVLAIVIESMDSVRLRHEAFFSVLEAVVVLVFSVELLVRLWSAPDAPRYARDDGALRARIRYLLAPLAIIDIAAVLPFYLALFGIFGSGNMLVLRSVRLLRILKLTRYSASFTVLLSVIHENVRGLAAAFFLLNVVMLLAACGIYVFEHEAQPKAFGSIPAAMWWAFATLTTVGYGDVTPITAAGRVFGASITVVGVGMVALPTAILASAFSERLRLRAQRYREQVAVALDDGVLTSDEAEQLRILRRELDLGSDLARQIVAAGAAGNLQQAGEPLPGRDAVNDGLRCPHCQGLLEDELPKRRLA